MNKMRQTTSKKGDLFLCRADQVRLQSENGRQLCSYELFCSSAWVSLSVSASLLGRFCISKPSFARSSQVRSKSPVAEGSCFRFFSPKVPFDAYENLRISPGFKVLKRLNDFKIQQADVRNGLLFGLLEECSRCCGIKPQSEKRRIN